MEGFKNTTRMKTFGDEAPQAYAKGGSVKPMAKKADAPVKKANSGDMSKMRPDQRLASMEKSSRAMTPAETRSLQATMAAKAAAPKKGPLIKPARQMTPAERRMTQMDRPTNNMGAEAYKGGGKVGGSKVPFIEKKIAENLAVKKAEGKKVMRKAMGGSVNMPQGMSPEMPTDYSPPPAPMVAADYSPTPMPEMPMDDMRAIQVMQQMQEMQAMQDMQAQRDAAQMRREAAPRFMR
jgi:hypothetical protein